MAIDWITVSAQIVNFLLLVWLLKRFLYQPVMHAMERREQRIAGRLEDAEERERLAAEKARHHQQKTEELENMRDGLVAQTRLEAEHEKRNMLDEARDEVAEIRKQWLQQANLEKTQFLKNLQRQTADTIQVIARKALADLADAGLEEQIVESFIQRLESLEDDELRRVLRQSPEPATIVSAFELPAAARGRITRVIHEHLGAGIEVEYDRSPELLCGIELNTAGRRMGWNIDDYLDQISGRVEQALTPVRAGA